MQINLSEDRASKIKTSKSIRISLLEEERIVQMGMTVTEALREGLDWVLSGRPGGSMAVSECNPGWESHPMWQKHVGYFDASRASHEFEKNWFDFEVEMESEGEVVLPEMKAMYAKYKDKYDPESGLLIE